MVPKRWNTLSRHAHWILGASVLLLLLFNSVITKWTHKKNLQFFPSPPISQRLFWLRGWIIAINLHYNTDWVNAFASNPWSYWKINVSFPSSFLHFFLSFFHIRSVNLGRRTTVKFTHFGIIRYHYHILFHCSCSFLFENTSVCACTCNVQRTMYIVYVNFFWMECFIWEKTF